MEQLLQRGSLDFARETDVEGGRARTTGLSERDPFLRRQQRALGRHGPILSRRPVRAGTGKPHGETRDPPAHLGEALGQCIHELLEAVVLPNDSPLPKLFREDGSDASPILT